MRHKIQASFLLVCLLLTACSTNSLLGGTPSTSTNPSTGTTVMGSGAQQLQLFVEPEAKTQFLTDAIANAQKSVWLEMYLLTTTRIIRALEEAAHRGIDVRVMLEPHPYTSSGYTPDKTLDILKAAGVKAQASSPNFSLTHEKGMIIDGVTAYIMTSNFTNSALGGSTSGGVTYQNREFDIVDSDSQDVQAIIAIFNADWQHGAAQFNAPNLVVSPTNSRTILQALIANAHHTLVIDAEEMQDDAIEQALVAAVKRGVQVQVILPAPQAGQSDSNSNGIAAIKAGGVQVKEDSRLYMHAKMMVVDAQKAFVGSENISGASLDGNRELGVIIADTQVINTLQQTFQQDWNDSQSV